MDKIGDLFDKMPVIQKSRRTQRGDFLEYFVEQLNRKRDKKYRKVTIGRVAKLLEQIPTKDLYYVKSIMEDKLRRGENAAAWFYWSLKNHETN